MMKISKGEGVSVKVFMKAREALPELMNVFRLISYQSAEGAVSKVLEEQGDL